MQFRPVVFKQGGWSRHLPFVYDLVAQLHPKTVVELGTHRGESYFGICQSVKDHKLHSICYAVDTWQGDAQAGFYGDEVYNEVQRINAENYQAFSYLVRSTFEEAAKQFSDGSVDLLHIDGFHTYEAVKQDFNQWFDKVSNDGILLFHDIVVRHGDFGVWKFWNELREKFTTFSFIHGHGLGVLFKNPDAFKSNPFFAQFITAKDESAIQAIHDRYRTDYERMELEQNYKELLERERLESAKAAELRQRLADSEALNAAYAHRYRHLERLRRFIRNA